MADHPQLAPNQEWNPSPRNERQPPEAPSQRKLEWELESRRDGVWRGSPVTYHEGPIDELRMRIPAFARQTYSVDGPGDYRCINSAYDSIVRLPLTKDELSVPIGLVSKSYSLFQHRDLIDIALESVRAAGIEEAEIRAEIGLTELGERMILRLYFPKSYEIDPGDGHPIGLRLECFNSVDGSCRVVAVLGWIRFVCANGMVLGKIKVKFRRIHNARLKIKDLRSLLTTGLETIQADQECFRRWYETKVDTCRVVAWIDGDVRDAWGVKAAAQALHIIRTGRDAVLARPFEKGLPSERTVEAAQPVPGAYAPAQNLFHVSQVLFWLAQQRRELEERLEWEVQAYTLLKKLSARRMVPST